LFNNCKKNPTYYVTWVETASGKAKEASQDGPGEEIIRGLWSGKGVRVLIP